MADFDRIAHIREYLEQHRDTYDRDALRRQLLTDGHDPEAIDAAMAQVYHSDDPVTHSAANRIMVSVPLVAFGIVLLNVGLCILGSPFAGIPFIVGLALELGAATYLSNRQPILARGIRWGLAISGGLIIALIALVFLLILLSH